MQVNSCLILNLPQKIKKDMSSSDNQNTINDCNSQISINNQIGFHYMYSNIQDDQWPCLPATSH